MEFGLLGTLEVRSADGPVASGRPKQRALLVLLLLRANQIVARERLIENLWGEEPPDTALKALQTYVSGLRKVLPDGMLVTRAPGYVLQVAPEAVDLLRAERLLAAARGAPPETASRLLHEALALWRGRPLAEFAREPFWPVESGRLEDMRLAALEERIDADLALGRHAELVAELELLIAEQPHRERFRGQLMLALYRAGRQADALEAHRATRAALDELGLEPGAALRQLEQQMLTQDPALDLARERPRGQAALPGQLRPAPPFAFVGRAEELELLRSLLARAEAGEGGLVLLGSEAGGGKTRLARELAHEAAARGVLVLYGASDAMVSTPYQPVRDWLEFLARAEPALLEECVGDRRDALSPLLSGSPPPAAGAEVDRYALQGTVCEVFRRLSLAQPVLLVADDAHWADAETLALLRRLAQAAPETRVLVLATHRDRGEPIHPAFADALAELSRLDAVTRLSLKALSADEVGDFVAAATAVEAPELASALAELTGGNALLVCETWRDLRESDALDVSDDGVRLVRPLDELRGPERIRDIVRQRLSRLSAQTAATVELAAVAGRQCELPVLAEAAGLQRDALVATLGEAIRNGLLEELVEPANACRFTHELVRRAVYDRVPGADRAQLHLRLGEALERAHASDPTDVLPALAHHFTVAVPLGGAERAVDYNLRAAAAAIAAAAYDEGTARLSAALELGIADPRERARTQLELAFLYHELGRIGDSRRMLTASLDAATGLEERGVAAHALLQRRGMGDPYADPAVMQAIAEEALETFRQLGDERGLALAGRQLGLAFNRQGRLADCCAAYEAALVHADATGDGDTRRRVVGGLAYALWAGPTPVPEAILRCEALRREARNDRVSEAVIDRCLAALLTMAGRSAEAGERLERSSSVLDEVGLSSLSWTYRNVVASTKLLIGDRAGAERDLEARWHWFRDLGDFVPNAIGLQSAYMLALLYCDDGRWEDAEGCLAYGAEVPARDSFLVETVLGLVGRARLAAHRGELADALGLARCGAELSERSDLLDHRATVQLALAAVQRAAGEPADAAVAEAIRLYEAKGNVAAAAQVRAAAT